MRKNPQYVVQMTSSEINLDLSATIQQPIALSSADSAPNRDKDKYPMDDIKDPTPCTVMYVKYLCGLKTDKVSWPPITSSKFVLLYY
jgi:hypothetical protein